MKMTWMRLWRWIVICMDDFYVSGLKSRHVKSGLVLEGFSQMNTIIEFLTFQSVDVRERQM